MHNPELARILAALAAAWLAAVANAAEGEGPGTAPAPTFRLTFDGSAAPDVAAGVRQHPSLASDGLAFTDGRAGKALLLGKEPIVVYQAHGNIPDEATLSFWLKPLNWQPLREWRKLVTICTGGRGGMMFAHFPGHRPDVQFRWSRSYGGPGHEATDGELVMDEWNHVAIAWDGFRSRVYFNGAQVLSEDHPSGFRPRIGPRATLHFGGILLKTTAGSSFGRNPWGVHDTVIDDFSVFPGMLSPAQIALLAGKARQVREFRGQPPQPQILAVPELRQPPEIDGRLGETEWQGAANLPVLIDAREPARSFDYPRQDAYFGYDQRTFYMALRCHFPVGAQVPKGGPRKGVTAPDVEVFGDESFELWLYRPDTDARYRFAGNVGGGFTEMLGKDKTWNGQWTYRTSMTTTIHSSEVWHVEVAVPLATLGIKEADGAEMTMNICRTWRCLDSLGLTNWAGAGNYPIVEHYGRIRLSPSAPGFRIEASGSPTRGRVEHTVELRNGAVSSFAGTVALVLEAAVPENDRTAVVLPVDLAPGRSRTVSLPCTIDDPQYQRIQYRVEAKGHDEPLLRYSVPFQLRTDFLDVIPLNLQHKLVVKPAFGMYQARAAAAGKTVGAVGLSVLDPNGTRVAEATVTSDGDVWLDLSPDGPWGDYRVTLADSDADGTEVTVSERDFHRPQTPVWATQRDDSMDRVLPPFTPLRTETDAGGGVTVSCWGREYRFRGGLFPASVGTGGVDNILDGPTVLVLADQPLGPVSLQIIRQSDVRNEFTATAETARADVRADIWIEYDGLIWYELEITPKTAVKQATLEFPFRREHAHYAHCTASMMSLGGGFTAAVDQRLSTKFWPVVWLGDFERGLCWFTEGSGDLRATVREPIVISPSEDRTVLSVRLADDLAAGDTVHCRFGLLATPVKPQHPRYPLNIFAYHSALWDQTPRIPLYSTVWWTFHKWFLDLPEYNKTLKRWGTPADWYPSKAKETSTIWTPYLDPCTLTPEYAEARHYLREWEILPAQHRHGMKRKMPDGGEREYAELWMSPASKSYRTYYAFRIADLIRRTGLRGLYFDFGCAMRDANRYHGARGGYYILGLRDFYRRLVNEFVKAGVEEYVIVVHNSRSVQIPALTFATHFFNGEHHRAKSGTTLHQGRDYLDTLPLRYFGIEQSGLPWGIHGNMLPEFPEAKHLLPPIGVKDETVTEYLWDRTSSVVMPILLHGCLPGGVRVSHPYYKHVVSVLTEFDVPTAVFHPYWRNAGLLQVDSTAVKVSVYSRPEAPKLLLVVGNLHGDPTEATVRLKMTDFYSDWTTSPLSGMKRVEKKGELLQVIERIGVRDARILDAGPNHIKLWVNGHSMALVEASGHEQVR